MEDKQLSIEIGVKIYPEYAEHIILSDYIKSIKIESKYIKGLMIETRDIFHCPRCDKKATQEHGIAYECGDCGLKRQSFGNSLYIWE